MLAILSVLAIGLGRTARIDLSLAKHRAGKLRADFLGWASVYYAMNQLRLDSEDPDSSLADTVYTCGFALKDNKTPEDLFKGVTLASGSFDIGYPLSDNMGRAYQCYGFEDEDRRLNINGIHQQNYRILAHLFMLFDVPDEQADGLAAQVVDWKDADSNKMTSGLGAEKESYDIASGKFCKDAPFEHVQELMFVRDMTENIFLKIKKVVTVFPRQDMDLAVNLNTAEEIVLRAIFRSLAEKNTSVNISDVDSLVGKISAYRKGEDGLLCTADDRPLKIATASGDLGLNANEQAIYLASVHYLKETSQHVRLYARGVDDQFKVRTTLDAVISRETLSVLLWNRK